MKELALMWPRMCEIVFAICLAVAPLLLGSPTWLRVHDMIAALVMLGVSVSSMLRPRRLLNLCNLAPALWLVGFALVHSRSVHSPTAQSELLIGLLLAMFAIIPTRTMQVPSNWRRFFSRHPETVEQERRVVAHEAPQ